MQSVTSKYIRLFTLMFLLLVGLPLRAQYRSTISGTITDPQGKLIANASITITDTQTGTQSRTESNSDGIYSFPELTAGTYQLEAEAPGFQRFTQQGIVVQLSQASRVDIKLPVGNVNTTVTVNENASPLNFDTITLGSDISPEVENKLPVEVSGTLRNAATFVAVQPGVNSNHGVSTFSSLSINGGKQKGTEAIVDGVSMQEGDLSQGGTVAEGDFPMSPDMMSEVKTESLNYGVQYGATTSGVIEETTKSGSREFHGDAYEYLKNTDLNAKNFGAARKSPDNEHEFGGGIGGPVKLPFVYTPGIKTYFYFNYEQYQQLGGVNPPVLTIPTLKNRIGDFSDQINGAGQLIPIYDPATTAVLPNGTVTRKQFMGCNGNQPNVICPNRLSPIALAFNQFLPQPTNSLPTSNYQVPKALPDAILEGAQQEFGKIDLYVGESDHFAVSLWHQGAPQKFNSELPPQLSYDQLFGNPESSWVNRLNWDHTFSVHVLNHFAFGYLNRHEGEGSQNYRFVNDLPQIPGVADSTQSPPEITQAGGYAQYGRADGNPSLHINSRPEYIPNDLLTLVKGKHTFSVGGEFRALTGSQTSSSNESGTFNFAAAQTGLLGVTSGNAAASFLLGAVSTASSTYYSVYLTQQRQYATALFGSDVWKVMPRLTLNYGLRWDYWTPVTDAGNKTSWTNLSLANPGAGGRPGAIVFATKAAGAAYAGKSAPENPFYAGFAPRLGFIFAPSDKMTVTAGYGISFDQLVGHSATSTTGFNNTPSYSSTGNGGLNPAFYLSQGFPGNPQPLPDFSIELGNGGLQSAPWRDPIHGARRPYVQQWDLAVQQAIAHNAYFSIAYVGEKSTHLTSGISPQNVLNPSLLSMGNALNATFAPGQSVLDGVPIPYPGWVQQMNGCAPTVAQALLPYPQFCQSLINPTENNGFSIYHSLQLSAEKRYASGLYLMANYTWAKLIGTSGDELGGSSSLYSPFQQYRYHQLNAIDIPQTFNFAAIYELPFGRGERFLSSGRLIDALVGGWEVADVTHLNSGNVESFGASCNYPGQFQAAGCYPALIPGQSIKAASKSAIDHAIASGSAYTAFNRNAFAGANFPTPYQYNFAFAPGPEYPGARGFGYVNSDSSLTKTFKIGDRVSLKVAGQFFNVFNQHTLGTSFGGGLTSTNFGQWTGTTSNPRQGQVSGRIEF